MTFHEIRKKGKIDPPYCTTVTTIKVRILEIFSIGAAQKEYLTQDCIILSLHTIKVRILEIVSIEANVVFTNKRSQAKVFTVY